MESLSASRAKTAIIYGTMIARTVAVFLGIRWLGSDLAAPSPTTA